MSEQTANLCTTDAAEAMRETIADQAREIERLGAELENTLVSWGQVRLELAALKAQPGGVVLPERKRTEHLAKDAKTMTPTRASIEGYNRALDDVARLNSSPVSAGETVKDSLTVGGVDERAAFEKLWQIRGKDDEGNLGSKPLRSLVDDKRYRGDAVNGSWLWFQRGAEWQRAALTASAPNHSEQVRDVSAMARVLSDRQADACNVDRDDQWKIYGQDFIEDVTAMLAATPSAGSQGGGV